MKNSVTINVQQRNLIRESGLKVPNETDNVIVLSHPEISRITLGPWGDDLDKKLRSQTLDLLQQAVQEKHERI